MILIPKVSGAGDIHMLSTLLTQIEDASGIDRRIGIAALIETAPGMLRVDEIAAASPERMEALIFGVADYAASIQSQTASIGGSDANYAVLDPGSGGADDRDLHWGDQWHYPLARIAVACRANGLRPIDGPFGDFSDADGYLVAARRQSSDSRASGASTPARSSSRTRSSRPTPSWFPARAGSSPRWRRRPMRAWARSPGRPPDRRGLVANGRAPADEDRTDRAPRTAQRDACRKASRASLTRGILRE